MGQMVKSLHAMWETRVQSLGQEDPLDKEMAIPSVFLTGKFHGQRSLTGYISWSRKESDTTEQLTRFLFQEPGSILRACKYVILFKALVV